MQAELTVEIITGYIQTGFSELITLGTYQWLGSKCHWTFPVSKLDRVEAILGTPVEFRRESVDIIEKRTPQIRERVELEEFKGKSGIIIIEQPTIFIIIQWRKVETKDGKIEIKEMRHELPLGNVTAVRQALALIDESRFKDGKISCARIAEKTMMVLNINRFNRETGSFDWAKFYGNRSEYHTYYNFPLKVLEYKKEIIYHKNGKVTKLALQHVLENRTES